MLEKGTFGLCDTNGVTQAEDFLRDGIFIYLGISVWFSHILERGDKGVIK